MDAGGCKHRQGVPIQCQPPWRWVRTHLHLQMQLLVQQQNPCPPLSGLHRLLARSLWQYHQVQVSLQGPLLDQPKHSLKQLLRRLQQAAVPALTGEGKEMPPSFTGLHTECTRCRTTHPQPRAIFEYKAVTELQLLASSVSCASCRKSDARTQHAVNLALSLCKWMGANAVRAIQSRSLGIHVPCQCERRGLVTLQVNALTAEKAAGGANTQEHDPLMAQSHPQSFEWYNSTIANSFPSTSSKSLAVVAKHTTSCESAR